MNKIKRIVRFAGIASFLPLSMLAAPAVSTNPEPQPTETELNTHTLFMGTDVVIERDKKLRRVRDVVGSSFIVMVDGVRTTVPMRGGSHNLKLEQGLKLSSASASLTELTGERTYTPRNDPRMLRQKEKMAVTAALDDASSLSIGQLVTAQAQLSGVERTGPSGDMEAYQRAVDQAKSRIDVASRSNIRENLSAQSDLTSGAAIHDRSDRDLALENFDAIEISFTVSSETPLTEPYFVAITRFRPRKAKPDVLPNNAIYAKELGPIGSKPQRVSFVQGGFPPGFTLDGYDIHLYDRGIEIATNVAPNRVVLTREEAFRYLKIEYLTKHKADTLPASLAMRKIYPNEKPGSNPDDQSGAFCFIKVSKEGIPIGTFTDELCSQPADAKTEAIASTFRFFPALDQGKQVEGVVRVPLPQSET